MFFQAELQHQKRISLFSRQKCHAKLFSQRSSVLLLLRNVVRDPDNFFASYSHLRWSLCGVILLHVPRVGAGSFAVLVFLHFSILAFRRGIQSSIWPEARASQDLCTPLNLTKFTDHDESCKPALLNTRAGFRPITPILSKWFPDIKRAPCKCWQSWF